MSKQASEFGHASHVQTQPCLWDHHAPGFKEHENQAALGRAETSIPAPPALAHLCQALLQCPGPGSMGSALCAVKGQTVNTDAHIQVKREDVHLLG